MEKLAKELTENDKVVTSGGHVCDIFSVERVTNRRTKPHTEMIEITYYADGKLLGALFTLRQKVLIADGKG